MRQQDMARTSTGMAAICLVAMILSACSTPPLLEEYDPATSARIRVLSLPNRTYLYPGKACYAPDSPQKIAAHTGGRGYAFPLTSMNRRIGMPETGKMTRFYNEFTVHAGEPLTVEASDSMAVRSDRSTAVSFGGGHVWSTQTTCGPIAVTFVPRAGEDYEVGLHYQIGSGSNNCRIELRRLLRAADGKTDAVLVETKNAFKCPDADTPESDK